MSGKTNRTVNPIGLDLSADGLRAAQVEMVGKSLQLVDAAHVTASIRSDDDLRGAVERMLAEHRFVGQRVATSLPAEGLSVHHLRLPVMPEASLERAVVDQVAGRVPFDLTAAVTRRLEIFCTAGRDNQADHIVFVIPRETVEQHLRMAERLGLSMVGISAIPLALGHAFDYLGQRREESDFTFLLIHLEPRQTNLVILNAGTLRFARIIPHGPHDILDAAAKTTGRELSSLLDEQEMIMRRREDNVLLSSRMTLAPDAPRGVSPLPYEQAGPVLEGFADEITSCLCYFASTMNPRGVDKVIFTGSQANDYGFCQMLANRIGLPAQIGDPFAGITPAPPSQASMPPQAPAPARPHPEMAVAIGLSLFGAMVN